MCQGRGRGRGLGSRAVLKNSVMRRLELWETRGRGPIALGANVSLPVRCGGGSEGSAFLFFAGAHGTHGSLVIVCFTFLCGAALTESGRLAGGRWYRVVRSMSGVCEVV